MTHRRSLLTVIALLFGALAFFGSLMYLKNADTRAYGKAKLVDVIMVKTAIAKGTSGDQAISASMVVDRKIPEQFRPSNAITSFDDLRNKVALTALSPDQVVVAGLFASSSSAITTFSQRIPDGQNAITISVDQVHAVAGFIQPGDKVNIFVVGKDPNANDDHQTIRLLYQDVNVIAVGSATANPTSDTSSTKSDGTKTTTPPAPANLVTLAVPADAAENILLPASGANGSVIYLSLVTPTSSTVPTPGPKDLKNIYANPHTTPYQQ